MTGDVKSRKIPKLMKTSTSKTTILQQTATQRVIFPIQQYET